MLEAADVNVTYKFVLTTWSNNQHRLYFVHSSSLIRRENSFQIADVYFASLGLQIILQIHAFIFTHTWSFGHPLQQHCYWIRAAALTLWPQNLSFQMRWLTDRSNSYIHVFSLIIVCDNLTVEAFVSKLKGSAIYRDSGTPPITSLTFELSFLMWYWDPNSSKLKAKQWEFE